ncbi:MAG: hypothetical protein V3T86_09725 [Planctomycetota bacterium]
MSRDMARHCLIRCVAAAFPLVVACASKPTEPALTTSPVEPDDPVILRVTRALEQGGVDAARTALENDRWLAKDRGRAALLYYDCLLAKNEFALGIDSLRAYLEKTGRLKTRADEIASRLLAHHSGGGRLAPKGDDEACHFGLYALVGLREPDTARPMLEAAAKHAEKPERLLAQWALSDIDRIGGNDGP